MSCLKDTVYVNQLLCKGGLTYSQIRAACLISNTGELDYDSNIDVYTCTDVINSFSSNIQSLNENACDIHATTVGDVYDSSCPRVGKVFDFQSASSGCNGIYQSQQDYLNVKWICNADGSIKRKNSHENAATRSSSNVPTMTKLGIIGTICILSIMLLG